MGPVSLAADFPPATREAWLDLVNGVLKGGDFERRLVSRTYDGLWIEPLYPKAEGGPHHWRQGGGPWRMSQRVDHPEPAAANELALADLEGGADSLVLVLKGAPAARGFGLALDGAPDLVRTLEGVKLDLIHLRLDAGSRAEEAAQALVAMAEERGHTLGNLDLDLGLDPIGTLAATGRSKGDWDTLAVRAAATLAALVKRGFTGRAFLADGRPYHEAGAGEAQELAAVLATGVQYLRALEAGGHDPEAARRSLSFLLVADADEFLTIAKLRALRRLWARVEEACGLAPAPIRLHAETAWRSMTRRDPWTNMLRGTIAAFSAGIGGADSVTVLPFTAALGLPDGFARRMARNTQRILQEESNLWRVADPAAGSGAFEGLTENLATIAWKLFQEIEREGGMVASLKAERLQGRLAQVRAERDRNFALRRDSLIGTSDFPDLREAPVAVLLPAPPSSSPDESEGAAPPLPSPLPSRRLAEPFERLRDASDARIAATGARPRVFLANLGEPAAFTARATFAKNLFEAGGIEALDTEGFSSIQDLASAFAASGARIACLCSSDAIYENHALEAAEALMKTGATAVFLAGRPGALAEPLKSVGVSTYIFIGCDVLEALEKAHRLA